MPDRPDERDPDELPDWRDAGLPRYQGGTHRRIEEPPAELPLGFLVRAATVVPYLILGMLVFLAGISLLVIVLFGSGPGPSLLAWAHGRDAGQIAFGVLELFGLEAACAGVIFVMWLAMREGAKERPRAWFWPLSLFIGLCGVAGVLGARLLYPHVLIRASLGGHDWLAPLVLAAYLAAAAAYRLLRG
jgi:hypothetical protein